MSELGASTTLEPRRNEILTNLREVYQRIDGGVLEGKRRPRLVAVSKLKPISDILAAYEAGQRHFGENYVQELVEKSRELPSDIQWHFIGSLQSNKCKLLAAIPNLWVVETVDSIKKADALNKACGSREIPLKVFIQVNTSGEERKSGVQPDQCLQVAQHIHNQCEKLELIGLMTIGAIRDECQDEPNPDFLKLKDLKIQVDQTLILNLELSMGMSSDFEEAMHMGSTNIRVGTTIFGARPSKEHSQ